MADRDDFAELVGNRTTTKNSFVISRRLSFSFLASARTVTKCSSFYFNGRIRYGMKNERIEERFLVTIFLPKKQTLLSIQSLVYGCCSSIYLFNENPG